MFRNQKFSRNSDPFSLELLALLWVAWQIRVVDGNRLSCVVVASGQGSLVNPTVTFFCYVIVRFTKTWVFSLYAAAGN